MEKIANQIKEGLFLFIMKSPLIKNEINIKAPAS